MISATSLKDFFIGTGAFFGSVMGGIGVLKFCNTASKHVGTIPVAIAKGAEELEKLRVAFETNNALITMVTEQGGTLKEIRESVLKIEREREDIGRTLRLISRKIEGVGYGEG